MSRLSYVNRAGRSPRKAFDELIRACAGGAGARLASSAASMDNALAALIERHRGEIERRFAARLYVASAAKSLDHQAVIDSLHELLDELIAALRGASQPDDARPAPGSAAMDHGEQRFTLGYDIATAVREYGFLQEILFDLIEESGLKPSLHDLRTLTGSIASSMVGASQRYTQMRDAELQQQASQHLGFLAHELRDPLSAAKMGVALARETRGTTILEAVDRSLTRLSELIDDALVEVRLRGCADLQLEEIPLNQLVATIVAESAPSATAKGLEVRSDIHPDLSLRIDRRVMRSAVSNLVRNAVKFSRARGRIVVRAIDAGERVRIEVEDACGGLPEGAVEQVFDPYVQVGKDKSGFGLGLAIAKQAAMAHRGEIRVHDLPGKGCVFVIDLPRDAP